ncbi:LTA synthase family protein [Lachnospiraceae bacterium C1.1]|nr:LTA synthase family protein [Lachnospiraceae bacterium C1.1]
MEYFIRDPWDEKWGLKLSLLIINAVFYELLNLFLLFITGRLRWSLRIEAVILCFLGFLEYYLQRFRGKPLLPWDFSSISTAASVANNYDYSLDKRAITALVCFILILIAAQLADLKIVGIKNNKKVLITRIAGALLSFILIFPYAAYCQSATTIKKYKVYDKLFTPTTMTWRDGVAFAFIYDLQFMTVDTPAGYSKSAETALLEQYAASSESSNDLPNIIVIMDEAFSDPQVLAPFTTNEDYMPFMHSLMNDAENTISGYLNTSIVGGNTPNTEFEFLTGHSLAFLPTGSIPYQQFVTSEIDAMPTYLKSLGYNTLAMHPYKATGWDRDRVYPLIGFDDMHFVDYFEAKNPKYIRDYISDESLFEVIEEEYEKNKSTGEPFFSFNVTMQNHSEYSGEYDNFTPDITIDGVEGDKLITRYLSLEKITDAALQDMVEYFEKVDDKTIIVFFGDHQPTDYVVEPIWNLAGKKGSDLTFEETTDRYRVPFIIWANYDIDEASGIETSANYLGNLTLEAAGVPLSPYRGFLSDFSKKYPVISAIHVTDADGNDGSVEDMNADGSLIEYEKMQYYELFDDKDDYE